MTPHAPARPMLGLVVWSFLAGCGGAPTPEPDPQIEADFLERRRAIEEEKGKQTFESDLINIDKAIDKYAGAWMTSELNASEKMRDKLDTYLRNMVAKHSDRLLSLSEQRDYPGNRSIALAALGFTGRNDVLDALLNGARDDNEQVAVAALFGLAILQDPKTPPGVLGDLMNDAKRPADVRRNASLALLRLQEKSFEPEKVAPYWIKVLDRPIEDVDYAVALHAVRGLGLLRDAANAGCAERLASHPQPMLRVAAAIAMGRMKSESSVPALLALLGPGETNENVRLAARKALQALAGGIDREYDVGEWRKVFERERTK
ncbi:MAG: HEAT repeat domain-containing protein [Planctomycetota bacterium]